MFIILIFLNYLDNEKCADIFKPTFDLQKLQNQCLCLPYLNSLTVESHFKVLNENNCACNDQLMFDKKQGICRPPLDYIILAFEEQIVRHVIRPYKNKNFNSKSIYNFDDDPFIVLPIENVGLPISIQVDTFSSHRFIYWIDIEINSQNFTLKRANDVFSNKVIIFFFFNLFNLFRLKF